MSGPRIQRLNVPGATSTEPSGARDQFPIFRAHQAGEITGLAPRPVVTDR
jgi:hypothetical protein